MKHLFALVLAATLFICSGHINAQEKMVYVCPPCGCQTDSQTYDRPGNCAECGMMLVLKSSLKKENRMRIAFYLQNNVEVLDFAGPMEVFSYAGFEVFTVSKTKEPIKSQGILTINPDYSISDAPPADVLAFFGGGNAAKASDDPELLAWIRRQSDAVRYYFSVCTGAFMLARAGLLENKTATTFHNAISALAKQFPAVKVLPDVRYVDNGHVITTAGISAGIDGALHLVEKIKGRAEAERVVKYMEYDNWVPEKGLVVQK